MNSNLNSEKREIMGLVKLINSKQYYTAEKKIKEKIKIHPNSPILLNLLGLCFINQNQIDLGVNCYKNAIKINPNYAEAYNNLGISLKNSGKIKEAINCYQNAIKFKPNFAEAYNNLGLVMMDEGKTKEAKINFQKALKIKPDLSFVHRHLSIVTKYKKIDTHINEMEKIIDDSKTKNIQKVHLAFGLGKAFEDIEDYKNAFKYYKLGNDLRRKEIKYNIKNDIKIFSKIKKIFNKNLFNKFKNSGCLDTTPIFIVGMHRSGTTLIEQILSSHSKVYGGGESKVLLQLISKFLSTDIKINIPDNLFNFDTLKFEDLGKSYITVARKFQPSFNFITDKQPPNFKWIGFIKLALPNAKIIHCVRNPKDNCLSIYKNYFNFDDNPYAYNLKELGEYYNLYEDLMKFWHTMLPDFIYDISYEKLIRNQKEETKKLLNICNLNWEENCMNFFKNKRYVSTASVLQVRRPIYKDSINFWKKYKKYLSPLIEKIN